MKKIRKILARKSSSGGGRAPAANRRQMESMNFVYREYIEINICLLEIQFIRAMFVFCIKIWVAHCGQRRAPSPHSKKGLDLILTRAALCGVCRVGE